jgi:hypothetical protein
MSDRSDRTARESARLAASEARSYARGETNTDHSDISPFAGIIEDSSLRHHLEFCRRAYERHREADEPRYEETEYHQRRLERGAGDMTADAVREGAVSQLEHLTGEPERESDLSGLKNLQRLERWLLDKGTARMIYLAGHQGAGKTDLAHLLLEVLSERLRQRGEEVDTASNIKSSTDLDRTIQSYERLREWFTTGSPDDNKWYIFDEASSELSGYSTDAQKVSRYMSSLIKKMRKNGCNLIIIGHTGKDVHPDIRRLSEYVEKPSQKTARVYQSVKNGSGAGHQFDLRRLPPTDLEYDTADEATFSWEGAGEDIEEEEEDPLDTDEFREWRNQKVKDLYSLDSMTQSDVSSIMEMSTRQVRRVLD